MNVLIIIAHPSKDSFSNKIAKAYSKGKKSIGDKVKTLNLYDNYIDINYLQFNNISKKENELIKKSQKLIHWADEIILCFPIWNLGEPAILKNWFDLVFTSGFAFKYKKGGSHERLLSGRSAKIFATCNGKAWKYKMIGNPVKTIWKSGRLGFCGIKLKEFNYIDSMRKRDENNRKETLKIIEMNSIRK